ncbi:MAG: tyrosine-type recombinase/integrase [Gaiellaceae bacterium]
MQAQRSEAKKKLPTGIRERHSRTCPSRDGGKCNCDPAYEAAVYDARESRRLGRVVKIRRTFTGKGALAAAKGWRRDAGSQVARGEVKFEPKQRLEDAVAEWLEKCERGEVRSRRRTEYSASTVRDYRSDLSRFVLSDLGHLAVNDVTRADVQAIIERMNGQGFAGQTVRNAIVALQAFYRWKKPPIDPTVNLDLPEPGGRRERAATPTEAELLLGALEGDERDVYACAFYAGLRRGELQALRVEDVLEDRIRVSRSWDQVTGEKAPKSKAGKRDVPLIEPLREILDRCCKGRPRGAFVFGSDEAPFAPATIRERALKEWAAAAVGAFVQGRDDGLEPIGLHEARHSFSTWLDHAGVSETRADRYMGHANPSVQARYRHQLEDQLAEDAARLESYLAGMATGKVVTLADAAGAAS